jgi:hypothetical protein
MLYDIEWQQTTGQRYDTTENQDARDALTALGFDAERAPSWGGSGIGLPEDALCADNGLSLDLTDEQVEQVRTALRAVIANPDTLTITPAERYNGQ